MSKLKKILFSILIVGLVLLTFLPRVSSLSRHWASDEDLWMQRSHTFFFALQNGKFADTLPAYHPGVTTMWLGSLGLWSTYLSDSPVKSEIMSVDFFTPAMLARVRLPIVLLTGILIFLVGFCIYRLFGSSLALLSIAFLSVEPFLLSESRRAHTDVLTALFLFLSLLLWLCYLEGNLSGRCDVVLSGISFALACLTKSYAVPFVFFLPLLLVWYLKQRNLSIARLLWVTLLWLMVALMTGLIVCPYMWTRPQSLVIGGMAGALLIWSWRSLSRTEPKQLTHTALEVLFGLLIVAIGFTIAAGAPILDRMFWALTEAHDLPKLFLGDIRQNPGWLYFPIVWGVWSGLLTLPLMGFALYRAWHQRNLKDSKIFCITVVLAVFILFYLLGLSIVAKKISRYMVIFLPAVSLLTVLGGMNIAQRFSKKWIRYTFLVFIFLLQALPMLRLHPYYRTYHHPLVSGTWIAENTTCITGAGLDLAADYLNAKPNAENLQVRTTWFSKDFEHYFVGSVTQRHHQTETEGREFNYDIEYLRDRQVAAKKPIDAPENYQIHGFLNPGIKLSRELEHVVTLNGVDYVWIYRVLHPPPSDTTGTTPKMFEPVK